MPRNLSRRFISHWWSDSLILGLGGFLASEDIQKDLEKDGFCSVGNFGLTDQTLAFDWIQQYITSFGGNKDNVTATGESAGAISIGHHFLAARPPVYRRASCMSGLDPTMPTWSLECHEKLYQVVLRYLKISPTDSDALDKLRAQSQHDLSVSTTFVNGVVAGTGNPCDDGWYHAEEPSMASFKTPLSWVKSFMAGDCLHEGMIFRWNIIDDDYDYFFNKLGEFIGKDNAGKILELYGIFPSADPNKARLLIEELLGDVYFKIPNWLTLQASKLPESYGYHFDEISELTGPLRGTAHHCHDLLYLFMNKQEALTPEKQKLAQ